MALGFNLNIPPPTAALSDKEAREALQLFLNKINLEPDDYIGFDTETHALKITEEDKNPTKRDPLDWMHDTVTFWSLSAKFGDSYKRYCFDQNHFQYFAPVLENPKAKLAGWNIKYDAHIAFNSGINIWNCKSAIDFSMAGSMLDENVKNSEMNLKSVARKGFNSEWRKAVYRTVRTEKGFSDFEKVPWALQEEINQEVERRIDPWVGFNMTPFAALFKDCIDPKTNKQAVEFKTSLYDLPRDRVVNYASLDALAHLWLGEHLIKVMKAHHSADYCAYEDMWDYFQDVEEKITEILWRMERRGLPIDKKYLRTLYEPMEKELLNITKEINRRAKKVINLRSPEQVARFLFGDFPKNAYEDSTWRKKIPAWTPTKNPKTDKETLDLLAATGNEAAKLINRHRKLEKILNTYVKKLCFLYDFFEDGRVHTNFKQNGTRTGRLSTAEPMNSQNIPNPENDEFQIRRAFCATTAKEYLHKILKKYKRKLIVADYAQLEMRIMAHFSTDDAMINAIWSGQDMHCITVERMWGIPYEEVVLAKKAKDNGTATEEQNGVAKLRSKAKTVGFGIFYGAGPLNISIRLECSKQEARDLIDRYFRAFKKVKRFINDTHWRCKQVQFVTTLLGRRRNLPDINSSDGATRSRAERESVNSIIQGTAADLAKAAMINVEFNPELNKMGVELNNQIHDELTLLGPLEEKHEKRSMELVKNFMEYPFEENKHPLLVPTPVDIKLVPTWSDAK